MTKTGGGSTVHVLTADEWEVWRDVRLRALAADPDAFSSTYEREAAFGEADWRERVSGKNGPAVIARAADGSAIGCGGGYLDGDEYHVVAMWTDPAHRGEGVGAAVLRAVCDLAPASASEVHLCVIEGNAQAQWFYEREGFRVTGRCSPLGRDSSIQKVYLVREAQPHAV